VRTSNPACDTTFCYTSSSDCQSAGKRSEWAACNQLLHTLNWNMACPPASYLSVCTRDDAKHFPLYKTNMITAENRYM